MHSSLLCDANGFAADDASPALLEFPPAKRRRQDSTAFEVSIVQAITQRLTSHFQTPLNTSAVKSLCDNVLDPGWSSNLAQEACEELSTEMCGFIAACGLQLQDFSPEEQKRDLWPLYLTLGPLHTHAFLQAFSIKEIRFYLFPLRKVLCKNDTIKQLSVEDVRQEIMDLEELVEEFASGTKCGISNPFHFLTLNQGSAVSDEDRANLCLLYIKLRHSQDVCSHFGVTAVDVDLIRRIFAVLAERDVRSLANGKAPIRAILARHDARKQVHQYRSQINSVGGGPRIVSCQRFRM